jgi:hypothetical protein
VDPELENALVKPAQPRREGALLRPKTLRVYDRGPTCRPAPRTEEAAAWRLLEAMPENAYDVVQATPIFRFADEGAYCGMVLRFLRRHVHGSAGCHFYSVELELRSVSAVVDSPSLVAHHLARVDAAFDAAGVSLEPRRARA